MDKKTEALKLALEALEELKYSSSSHAADDIYYKTITAIREALADHTEQPLEMVAEQPTPPPECQTEAEKTAFAFGWFKALEQKRKADSALDRMAENARELGLDYEPIVEQVEDSVGMGHGAWDMVEPKKLAKAFHEALAEQPALEQEIEELTAQRDKLADILTRTANALKGQPAELSLHSWHDLPEVAQQLKAAQQHEPYGWKVYGVNSLFMGEFAEADAKAEAKRIGGTCITFPLYTSPPVSKPWVGLTPEERQACTQSPFTSENYLAIEAKLKEKNT